VSPGLDWRETPGDPRGKGGPDYRSFPDRPYFLEPFRYFGAGERRPARGADDDTLVRSVPERAVGVRVPLLRQTANRVVSPALNHLCPAESRLRGMLRAARGARAAGADHAEFTLHSSELMPGGSPSFRDEADIACLYEDLEILFDELSGWCRGMTLNEFHAWFVSRRARSHRAVSAPDHRGIAAGL